MEEHKKFSAAEVSLHSTKKDCWLTIHGKVYDVTGFLEDHPGGEDVLIHAAGSGDATQSFEDVGHSSTAKSMMGSYMIGVLEGYDAKATEQKESQYAKPSTAQQSPTTSLVDFTMPLLILAVAFSAWYYLTYINKA